MTVIQQPSYNIQNNISLSNDNTMALACHTNSHVEFTNETQIIDFVSDLKNHQIPTKNCLILSGGSNVLLPQNLNAYILRPMLKGISLLSETDEHYLVEVKAGEIWHDFVMFTIKQGWYGLENMALIPGMVGAAPVQNIGAYGVELCDFFEELHAINISTGHVKIFSKSECNFSYRDSFFKQHPNQWLITKVIFKLSKTPNLALGYGDVANRAEEIANQNKCLNITPHDVAQAIIEIRQQKLPNPKDLANTGSFFKNPIIEKNQFDLLKREFPQIPHYPQANGRIKLAAGWLIDSVGLKGYRKNNIATHTKQALVIVNHAPSQSTQQDIAEFSDLIKSKVFETFNVQLEREPIWVHEDGSVC